jgi:hypothetical protein
MSQHTFAFIADGEVFFTFGIDSEADKMAPGIVAGLQSDPIVIEYVESEVQPGWRFDGKNFIKPLDFLPDEDYELED